MLLANRTVAEFAGKKRPSGEGEGETRRGGRRTMVYRVHDKPDVDRLASFRNFILRFGYYFKAEKGRAISREMNRLMAKIKGMTEENIISTLAVRSMAKAYYTTDNIGHYGLAFDYYTHFTSPIRRYPDMLVHRLLDNYLAGGRSPSKERYEELCKHASEREGLATEAERASDKYKMVEFMMDKIGRRYPGRISGVTEWGIYVQLSETHIEGMIALRDMTGDFYYYNPDDYAVVGRNTGRTLTLGDEIRVVVVRADLARKQLDFALAE
jgi:ribonuclease R